MPRSLDDVDRWIRDHELLHARDREERKVDDGRLIDAVKKHVDQATRPIADINAKMDRLVAVNDEQLQIARESAEERGRRMQREADAAAKKSEEEVALERAKVEAARKLAEAAEKQAKDKHQIERLKARNDRWKIIAGVVTAIAVAVISALLARH